MSKVSHGGHKGVEICLSWHPASGGQVPPNAVDAGNNCFVGRAKHNGNWIPAKVVPGHACAYLPYGGQEHGVTQYEVLVASDVGCYGQGFKWAHVSGGNVPKNALVGGTDSSEPLYVARGRVNGDMCVGKAHIGHGCAYFPWGGKEHKQGDYEVLVLGEKK